MDERVMKIAAMRVQSQMDRSDPAYRIAKRIAEDISSVSPGEVSLKDGDDIDSAVAEIEQMIESKLSDVSAPTTSTGPPSPQRDRKRKTAKA